MYSRKDVIDFVTKMDKSLYDNVQDGIDEAKKEILDLGDTKIDKTGDTKDNTATFTEAATDEDIQSNEKHSTIFGKILKSIKTFRNAIGVLSTLATTDKTSLVNAINEINNGKISKSDIVNQDTINDVNKVPSSAVTYAHGQALTELNNNLNIVKARGYYGYPTEFGTDLNTVIGGERHLFVINSLNTPTPHGFLDCSYFSGVGFTPGGSGIEPITLQTWHDYNTGIGSNRTYNHKTGAFSSWI